MNWGTNVQGPQLTGTVNVNSPWSLQAGGWAGQPSGQWGGHSQGWIPGPTQVNGNPGDMAWGSQTPRSQGMWDRGEQHQNNYNYNYNRGGFGFSGQNRNRGRGFHRDRRY